MKIDGWVVHPWEARWSVENAYPPKTASLHYFCQIFDFSRLHVSVFPSSYFASTIFPAKRNDVSMWYLFGQPTAAFNVLTLSVVFFSVFFLRMLRNFCWTCTIYFPSSRIRLIWNMLFENIHLALKLPRE